MDANFWKQFLPAVAAGAAFGMLMWKVIRSLKPQNRKTAVRYALSMLIPGYVLGLALVAYIITFE